LTRSSFRLWFCVGVAFIAAAIADPIVEFAANARWFGPGRFTDHSNLDVLPALLAGTFLLLLYIGLRVRSEIAGPQWPRTLIRGCDEAFGSAFVSLVPLAYCLQILVLYFMESCEQCFVFGHLAGGVLWLGGPIVVSLLIHAVACVLVAMTATRAVKALARTTLRVLRVIRTWITLPARPPRWTIRRSREVVSFAGRFRIASGVGERAPPLQA
jgi:hypothetical protein